MKNEPSWRWLWVLMFSFLGCTAFGGAQPTLAPPALPTMTAVPTQTEPPAPTITLPPTTAPNPAEPVRISFETGAVSAQVAGTVGDGETAVYLFRASAGQPTTITIESANSAANFGLTSPTGQPLKRLENESRTFELTLPESGDYRLAVRGETAVAYTLTLTILPLP